MRIVKRKRFEARKSHKSMMDEKLELIYWGNDIACNYNKIKTTTPLQTLLTSQTQTSKNPAIQKKTAKQKKS